MSIRLNLNDAQVVTLLEPCHNLADITDEQADAWFEERYSCSICYDRNALHSWFIDFDTELEMVEFKLRHL